MQTLKTKIIQANEAYRNGTPIMSDPAYDILLSELEDKMNFIEFEDFKKTLTETSGNIKHNYVIGSLNKLRYNENNEVEKFLKKINPTHLFAIEKLDGCSYVAKYVDGVCVQLASRGDGYLGTDWTPKAKYIMPKINHTAILETRGELVFKTEEISKSFGFKNRRNGVSGAMGRDTIIVEQLKAIIPITYQILNSTDTIATQLKIITELGFITPMFKILKVTDKIEEELADLYKEWKTISKNDIDGIVISSPTWKNENDEFYPINRVAFKVNSEGVKVKVIGVEWETSMLGAIKPVVLLTPTEIDGATISRVSGYNARFILGNKIKEGTIVSIIRSGMVIPKIIGVFN